MHKLILLVLLASLLESAAAAAAPSPVMSDSSPVVLVQNHMYAASNNILPLVCNMCSARAWPCPCVIAPPSYIDPALLSYAPEHSGSHTSHGQAVVDLRAVAEFNADYTRRQRSVGEQLQQMNENATTVQSETVLAHVHDTYAVGDRRPPTPPRASTLARTSPRPTRQVYLPGGYVCLYELCGKRFDHAYELKRHQRQHLTSSERPHKCSFCNEGFLYPKDLIRHQTTHNKQPKLFCRIGDCQKGFSRPDNRDRHERNQHSPLQEDTGLSPRGRRQRIR